ncbi:MAG: Calx-beta domain-containing protein [Isosphaeraceae bacterium]|nr:Calx-beta domain-containing protein [Isosphaeraceae bacterium]
MLQSYRRTRRTQRLVPHKPRRPRLELLEERQLLAGISIPVTSAAGDQSAGTLYAAILASNLNNPGPGGHNTITFDIASTGTVQTISLAQSLPPIAFPVTINGTTEPQFSGSPLIVIDGTGAGGNGLTINASNTTIEGLGIVNFSGTGISINSAAVTNTLIEANYIGINNTGAIAQHNFVGISINNSSGNTITGMPFVVNGNTVWLPNVVSGNSADQIDLSNSNDNLILGNRLGTNAAGTVGLNLGWDAIKLENSSSNTIGGVGANQGNLLSGGEFFDELQLDNFGGGSANNLIQGNFIGTNAAGTAALDSNSLFVTGILIQGAGTTGNTVGGTAAGAGNIIAGMTSTGVQIDSPGNVFEGNEVGIGANDAAIPNKGSGVVVNASNVTIGGTVPGSGNVISGNQGSGIAVTSSVATGVQITGNLIGVDAGGTNAVPNGTVQSLSGDGIFVQGNGVTIGGSTAGAANVISGNIGAGIEFESGTGLVVQGNSIGTDISGSFSVGNGVGILISGGSTATIGGANAGQGNVISGNVARGVAFTGDGIQISSSAGDNLFVGNLVGTDVSGTVAVPNEGSGIAVGGSSADDTIGGTTPGAGNVISGNDGDGILTLNTATGSTIQGNEIGTSIQAPFTGDVSPLGNGASGIELQTSNNLVGGDVPNAGNIIAFNGQLTTGDGIHVVNLNNAPTGDVFEENSIYDNSALGISLATNGITPTPIAPPATVANPYANNHINYPTITQAIQNAGVTTVAGLLTKERPNTTYNIEFYEDSAANASGYGEGHTLIGVQSNVQTDNTGSAQFLSVLNNASILAGDMISATVTDASLQDGTSEFAKDVPIQGLVDLSVQVSATPNPVYVGQTVTYTVTVTNGGTTDAHNVAIVDTLPASSLLVSALDNGTLGGTVVVNGSTVTDSLAVLPAGESDTLTIQVKPTQFNVPLMSDSAIVTTTDQNTNNSDAGAASVTVKPVVPLDLTVTASPNPAFVGQTLSYLVTIQNLNLVTPATGVTFTDTLDPNVVFNAATSTPGLVLSGTTLTDNNIGTIAAGQSVTLVINVTPLPRAINPDPAIDTGSVTNVASEAYNESASDPNDPLAPQSVPTTTPVDPVADVSVVFLPAPTPSPAPVDKPLTYTIRVKNNGPSTANNIVVTDVLDPNVTFVPGSSTPGWSASGQTLTTSVVQLAAGNSTTLTVVVTPNPAAVSPITDAGSVTNTASVAANETDSTMSNNTASISVGVTPVAVLTVTGSATPNTVSAGSNIVYTFKVTNTGPSTANDVLFSDPIPVNESYISAVSSQGLSPSSLNNTVTAKLGTIAPNQSATVTITLQPTGAAGNVGTVTNTASATADEAPAGPWPSATVVTGVTPSADVSVNIQAFPSPARVHGTLTYIVTAANAGPSDASDVVLTDLLDAGVVAGTITPSQGSFVLSGQTITADLGKIVAGGSATLTIVVTPQSAGTVTDSASVVDSVAAETDPNTSNNSASITTQVSPSADVGIQLVESPNPVLSGTDVLYTATATNNGPSTATGVTINDTIPNGTSLVSVVTSVGGTYTINGAVITGFFSSLVPGASASITIDVVPSTRGMVVDTATVSANEFDANLANNSASVTTTVTELPGTFDFLAQTYTANNNAGFAAVTVVRTDGLQGDVKVQYSTTSGTAKPGLDYTVTSGTLDFPDGVSTQTFYVPVLPYAYNRGDVAVGLVLSSPLGGAVLGPQYGALLNVHVLNPDVTPPTVTNIAWYGVGQSSSDIVVDFSKPMDAASVSNVNNYQLVNTGKDTIYGTKDDSRVAIASATYNSADNSVVLVPASPLRSNAFYHLVLNGSQGSPIMDIVSNPLAGSGAAGSDDVLYFASGSNLTYIDAGGNQVNLRLTGAGGLNLTRFANGQGDNLQIVGEVPHRTILQGTIRRVGRVAGTGTTSLNSITGLGNFGDVRVRMSTPPFTVTQPSFAAATPSVATPPTVAVQPHALHAARGGAFAKRHR